MSWTVNSTFDPFDQSFTVLGPDGRTPVTIPLAFVQESQWTTVAGGVCVGTQIGAATLLFVLMLLTTKKDKRRSLVFILNAVALLIVVLRGIFQALMYTGPFYDWYRYATFYYAHTGQAKAVSMAGELLTLLLYIVLELSLILQVRIVCCTLEPIWRHLVNIFNIFVALVVIGARLGLAIVVIKWNILGVQDETDQQLHRINKLASAVSILFVVSIGISAAIFSAKLAYAIRRRRTLGMTQFGPMQVIFIMGCQTMMAPFIFMLICFYGITNIRMQTFGPAVVALLLPLSAMWAAANVKNKTSDADGVVGRAIPFGQRDFAGGQAGGDKHSTTTDTQSDDSGTLASSPKQDSGSSGTAYGDLEMGKMEGGPQQPDPGR